MSSFSDHIINIIRLLKNIKSKYKADYIRIEKLGIIIVTDKVTSALDLQTIEKYIKNSNQIDADKIETPQLPQSKLYFKIISLPYLMKNMNVSITFDMVEKILKSNHIFNNILIASWSRIIKVFQVGHDHHIAWYLRFLKWHECERTYQQMLQCW